MMMTCMIIDDEPLAHEVLETFISRFPGIQLVKKCTDAYQAIKYLYDSPVDFVFLDINMPEVDGIALLKSLSHPPLAIFTTAFRDYALDGYELNIVDFLLKPFSFNRFALAVNKVTERLENISSQENEGAVLVKQESIFIRSGLKMVRVYLDDIIFIEGMKDYLKIHLRKERIVVKETMKKMVELLPEKEFLRVHKSFIVSRRNILAVERSTLDLGGISVPIGRNYQELVHQLVK